LRLPEGRRFIPFAKPILILPSYCFDITFWDFSNPSTKSHTRIKILEKENIEYINILTARNPNQNPPAAGLEGACRRRLLDGVRASIETKIKRVSI
jgi:hypothetical protein